MFSQPIKPFQSGLLMTLEIYSSLRRVQLKNITVECRPKSMNFVFRDTVIGIGVEEEDRKHTWMEDANSVSTKSNQHILYHIIIRTFLSLETCYPSGKQV